MIRASSVHKILTNRPFFDLKAKNLAEIGWRKKVEAKGLKYSFERKLAEDIIDTPGLKTVAKDMLSWLDKRHQTLTDPLPPGALTYLQELYLELNYGFYNMSIKDSDPALRKGTLVEDDSIALLSKHLGIKFENNKARKQDMMHFLTGEADILHEGTVRDIKSPLNWSTFRKKDGIESQYYWQLIAYCFLYGKQEAYLDYVLMPMPEEMIIEQTKYSTPESREKFVNYNYKISEMPASQRIKTYQIPNSKITMDMVFMTRRLKKAKEYYETLSYEKCMKM